MLLHTPTKIMKKLRSTTKSKEDCISNLPVNVICHILSRLPTKDAVRTSLLSQQWKFNYTSICNIHIDELSEKFGLGIDSSFHTFMKKRLAHDSKITSCSLVIKNRGIYFMQLPRNLLTCVSLTKLKISWDCTLPVLAENWFPNLKSLYLESVKITSELLITKNTLTLTFPVLEVLEMRRCVFLEYQSSFYKIDIVGPKLVELTLGGNHDDFGLSAPELHFLALEYQCDYASGYIHLFKDAPRLKCLKLSGEVAKVFASSQEGYFHAFARIRQLELCFDDAQGLLKLLQVMPYLEVLSLNMLNWNGVIYEQDEEPLSCCIASHSHIKELEFINFMEIENHLHLINLLLDNTTSLERVMIRFGGNNLLKILHDSKSVRVTRVRGDHSSSLPDDVISHILSRLPTKDAVKTSLLSHQWINKYASVYDINIDTDVTSGSYVRSSSLPSFIDKLLTHYDSRIVTFRLVSRYERPSLYQWRKWIPQILSHNVQNLVIDVYSNYRAELLECLLAGCTSLTTLHISLNCAIKFPVRNRFPKLKSLHLGARNRSIHVQNALLIFPALEFLEMKKCAFPKVNHVQLDAPQLITFKYECSQDERADLKIEICGPKLAEFHYSGGYLRNFVLDAPKLHHAALDLNKQIESQILASRASALLNGTPRLKCLKLSRAVAEALAQWKGVCVIPAFNQLKRLEICCHPKILLVLLQLMPCLESLKLNIPYWHDYKQKEPLPLCIAPRLKEVEFIYFYGGISQIDLTKLFVENVKCLERVIVCLGVRPRDAKTEITSLLKTLKPSISEKVIRDRLSTLKPANSRCNIVFK